jgi:16S rRNA (guanine(966)-N(2))-methyltransferase RsmD
MRVISGRYRSRPLRSLPGVDIRPTSDRLRETLFNVLTAGNPDALSGSVWLDLYAGTGAVGIEAISRGASMVYFVDSSPKAADLVERNLASLQIQSGFQILAKAVPRALLQLQTHAVQVDFCFLDPPYRLRDAYAAVLKHLGDCALLKDNTLVIAEHEKKFDPGERFGSLQRTRRLLQGDAGLSFYTRTAP